MKQVMLLYQHLNCVPQHMSPNGCPASDQQLEHKAMMATEHAFVLPKVLCAHTNSELILVEINGKVI